jgi:hypothetical protein
MGLSLRTRFVLAGLLGLPFPPIGPLHGRFLDRTEPGTDRVHLITAYK